MSTLKRNRVGHRALHSALVDRHKSFFVGSKRYKKKQPSKKQTLISRGHRKDMADSIRRARAKSGKSGIHSAD